MKKLRLVKLWIVPKKKNKKERALKEFARVQKLFTKEVAWRKKAATDLTPDLGIYEQAIRANIGLRLQSKLPKNAAIEVAACMAVPRDLTLHF